jgi:hypothetical protein
MPQFRFVLIDESAGESEALSRGRAVLRSNPRAAALETRQFGRFVARLTARRGCGRAWDAVTRTAPVRRSARCRRR